MLELPPSKEEQELSAQVRKIEIEAREYDLPSTFMTWAKMKRQAAKIEKEVLKKEEARRLKTAEPWRQFAKKMLGYRNTVVFLALFFAYESTLVKAPLLEFPSGWMFPFSRILALPNYSGGALSVIGWSVLCQRFFGRFLKL